MIQAYLYYRDYERIVITSYSIHYTKLYEPVFALQPVIPGELLFRIEDQGGKSAGGMDLYHPHVETGRNPVEGVAANEGVITSYSIHYTKLYDSHPENLCQINFNLS